MLPSGHAERISDMAHYDLHNISINARAGAGLMFEGEDPDGQIVQFTLRLDADELTKLAETAEWMRERLDGPTPEGNESA